MIKDIYCISGLGADQRIFSRITIPGVRLVHLPWLIPDPGETISNYALRMKAGINGDNPVLMGVSFGGMMALEIAKYYTAPTVILVSSVGQRRSLPRWMRACGWLRLNRLLPARPGKGVGWLENYYLGVETAEDAELAKEFRGKTDPHYLHWAIGQILNWKNEWLPASFYHLHGSRDRIFPLRGIAATFVIPDSGHFMINNRAAEVNRLLEQILTSP
jgi:pimeloyl-ACP methyl ester carboxylesterase